MIKFHSLADWLAATREYIEKNGWWKGRLIGPNGNQACTVGAALFSANMGEDKAQCAQMQELCVSVYRAIPQNQRPGGVPELFLPVLAPGFVMNWNDEKERTKQEVLDVLAKAEKIERAGYDPDGGTAL
jgi:hypothetical protein